MLKNIVEIEFEDHGQDYITWQVEKGVVVATQPSEVVRNWVGAKVLSARVGEQVVIEDQGIKIKLPHAISSIVERVQDDQAPSKTTLH